MHKILVFAIVFFLSGCTSPHKEEFYTIVNENFFTILDTSVYKSGSLFLGMTEPLITRSKFLLKVDTSLENSDEIEKSVSNLVKKSHQNFRNLLEADSIKLNEIDTRIFSNTGKF